MKKVLVKPNIIILDRFATIWPIVNGNLNRLQTATWLKITVTLWSLTDSLFKTFNTFPISAQSYNFQYFSYLCPAIEPSILFLSLPSPTTYNTFPISFQPYNLEYFSYLCPVLQPTILFLSLPSPTTYNTFPISAQPYNLQYFSYLCPVLQPWIRFLSLPSPTTLNTFPISAQPYNLQYFSYLWGFLLYFVLVFFTDKLNIVLLPAYIFSRAQNFRQWYRYENQFCNLGFTNRARQFCGYQHFLLWNVILFSFFIFSIFLNLLDQNLHKW